MRVTPGPECPHLDPIEQAMLAAGIDMPRRRSAKCRIDKAGLSARFALGPSLFYREGYMPERHPLDNPHAGVICWECCQAGLAAYDLETLHPDFWTEETPWFPGPPDQRSPGK